MNPTEAAIHAFISQRHPEVSAFLITTKRDGLPYVRQVGTFVEGWTIQTISQPTGPKMTQLRNNPNATYMWVQPRPGALSRNVWAQGTMEIVEDPVEVQEFLERRARSLGTTSPKTPADGAVLLRMRPNYLRAEHLTEDPRNFFMREFPDA